MISTGVYAVISSDPGGIDFGAREREVISGIL